MLMLTALAVIAAPTLTGLDVLEQENFAPFAGKRIGLVTNHTGVDRQGRRNVDAMRAAGVRVTALFSPEHGLAGVEDREGIGNMVDTKTGTPVFSLYGETKRPTPESLKNVDALVFDIQDVGVRFYTYETTMAYAMESAAKAGIPFYVLDRPNPITGLRVEGPPLDASNVSFVGYLTGMPVRHGLTMGELARLFNGERKLGVQLIVVPVQNWRRRDWYDSTGLAWINPSPNMRSLTEAILYPGICLVEFAKNLSVGRGTATPFEHIGADWIDGHELANYLGKRKIPGVQIHATRFTPTDSRLKGVPVQGVRFEIIDREQFTSVRLGLEVACALERLYPGKIEWKPGRLLIGSDDVLRRIAAAEDPIEIERSYRKAIEDFSQVRKKYLLYR